MTTTGSPDLGVDRVDGPRDRDPIPSGIGHQARRVVASGASRLLDRRRKRVVPVAGEVHPAGASLVGQLPEHRRVGNDYRHPVREREERATGLQDPTVGKDREVGCAVDEGDLVVGEEPRYDDGVLVGAESLEQRCPVRLALSSPAIRRARGFRCSGPSRSTPL